jgi:iron uptake system component EfeO
VVSAPRAAAQAGDPYRVNAGTDGCGTGWSEPTGGRQDFSITNSTIGGIEVYLQNATTKAIYLDVESLGSAATRSATVTLGDGRYRFVCLAADQDPALGPIVTISKAGHVADPTVGMVPVTKNDLLPAVKEYSGWIQSQLPTLVTDTQVLDTDVATGNLGAAKTDWLTAHLQYETLGAAYGAFGDLDQDINGAPAAGTTALTDPDLTGFRKIEALLFAGASADQLRPFTTKLVASATELENQFPHQEIDPIDVGLRSHEILENALQFDLTGDLDAASGSTLATIDANITGTLQALAPLRGILTSRYPGLKDTDSWLSRTRSLIESFRNPDGSWQPLASLSTQNREKVNSSVSQAVELLAPVAAICDPRRAA